MVSPYRSPREMARQVADVVMARPGVRRSEIALEIDRRLKRDLQKRGDPLAHTAAPLVSDNTIYRWIERSIELGLVQREGTTSAARYVATAGMRVEWLRGEVSRPLSQRRRVDYNEDFLARYVPNQTFYLSEQERERLAERCPVGSATLSKLGQHDVSVFLSDLAFWSSKLEGNEYDYMDTVQLIEHSVGKAGAPPRDRLMILNHHDAVRHIINFTPPPDATPEQRAYEYIGMRPSEILGLHAVLSGGLFLDPTQSGRIRSGKVTVSESAYQPPEIAARVQTLFNEVIDKAAEIENPWEQALFVVVHLSYLQPFYDCNKRTARVACNIPLLAAGVTPMSWNDVSRKEYVDALIAVYEFNDPILMAEVFTEGYLRSCERFSLLRPQQREPDLISLQYRHEVQQAVRAAVFDDEEHVPSTIPPEHLADFIAHLTAQLSWLKENPASCARFGLRPRDIDQWVMRNPTGLRDADSSGVDSAGLQTPHERMRA